MIKEFSTLLFIAQNFAILTIFYIAYFQRKKHKIHKKLNITAIIWDLLLILQIELTRGAIETASHPLANTSLLNFHILIAVTVVLLYPVAFLSGIEVLKSGKISLTHRLVGRTILILRTIVLITSLLIN